MMTDDQQLLERYCRERCEPAFGELVSRHIDLVYGAALRVANGDRSLAEDVTQMVFIHLARRASSLPRGVLLAGWLYRHASYTAAKAVRAEQRRKIREQTAMEMRALDDAAKPGWELIAPHLDESLNQLSSSDRDALVLRFLKRQDLRAVGQALGIGHDAAQKRVSRALEKLRGILNRRGLALTTTALTSALAAEAVTAAPAGLAVGVTAASLTAATETGTTLAILKLMALTKLQTGIVGAIVVAGLVTPLAIQRQAQAKLRDQNEALSRQAEQLANLQGENGRLSNLLALGEGPQRPTNEQFNEVLRLRGEIGRLQKTVQELTGSKTNEPLSREEALASMRQLYLDRVNRLKQLFAANPAEAVPELQYLNDRDWLELVRFDHHEADPDGRQAMSSARGMAQIHFAGTVLGDALRQYGKDNNGQFPTELSQLAPYFKSPVDASVLRDWTILPTSSLPSEMRVHEDWVITQKAPVNAALDQRIVVGLKFTHLGSGGNQWGPAP
jgi:RNA polymerase sigma factor (sigma-70 family)